MAKLSALKKKFAAVPLPVRSSFRDSRTNSKLVVGVLLVANLIAALFVFRPWADSPAQLAAQLIRLQKEHNDHTVKIAEFRQRVKKSEQARKEGNKFLSTYFLGRRTAASTLAIELTTMAKASGIRPKEHSFAFEQVEGSDNLAMMSITANYEGTYADLVSYCNKLDRSPRFFIIESLAAAPQQGGLGVLNIALKVNVFVRDDAGVSQAAENKPLDLAPPSPPPSDPANAPKPEKPPFVRPAMQVGAAVESQAIPPAHPQKAAPKAIQKKGESQ